MIVSVHTYFFYGSFIEHWHTCKQDINKHITKDEGAPRVYELSYQITIMQPERIFYEPRKPLKRKHVPLEVIYCRDTPDSNYRLRVRHCVTVKRSFFRCTVSTDYIRGG